MQFKHYYSQGNQLHLTLLPSHLAPSFSLRPDWCAARHSLLIGELQLFAEWLVEQMVAGIPLQHWQAEELEEGCYALQVWVLKALFVGLD